MKWVLNTYQVAQEWELERIIEVCQAAGYQGIEFLQDFKQKHGLEADASPEHVAEVKAKMEAANLLVASLTSCCYFHDAEPEKRQSNIAQVKKVIDQAVAMDCDHVRVLGDRVPDEGPEKERVLNQVAAALHELGRYAQPKGVTVSIEAHGSFTDPDYVVRVVKEANLPNVGIVFNSQFRVGAEKGWRLPPNAPSIAPLYELVGPYLTDIHTHPMERDWRYYQEMFRLLTRDGYKGYVSNECAYTGPDPIRVLSLYTALFHSFTS